MSREELNRIVSRDDKGINEAKGILSILYRRILFDLGVDAATLEQYLDRWVHDPNGPVKQTTKKITQARGNYIKKMIEPEVMTWKSFSDLLMMLYPNYIKIEITMGWPNDTSTSHSLTMDTAYLNNNPNPPQFYSGRDDVLAEYRPEEEAEEEDIYGNANPNQLDLFLDDDDDEDDFDDD